MEIGRDRACEIDAGRSKEFEVGSIRWIDWSRIESKGIGGWEADGLRASEIITMDRIWIGR